MFQICFLTKSRAGGGSSKAIDGRIEDRGTEAFRGVPRRCTARLLSVGLVRDRLHFRHHARESDSLRRDRDRL